MKDLTDYLSRYIPEHVRILSQKENVTHSPITKKEREKIIKNLHTKKESGSDR